MGVAGNDTYEADIRWTTHGVAHIRAESWGDLGFGQGWACARDQLPAIADQIVKVRSERALHFGRGPLDAHVASDFGYLGLGVMEMGERIREAQPPHIRELVSGYVAGYNTRLLEAHEEGSLPGWCRDSVDPSPMAGRPDCGRWIRPIDERDFYAHLADVTLMASGRNLAGLIGRAEAPGPDGPAAPSPVEAMGGSAPGASNGWAFGGDATASGHGLVVANPHFPWYGEARFWECHLQIPGQLDVYGVSLLGAPGVQMGFNEGLAWAHTFSCGHRFTVQRLDLVPGEPTSYRHGDEQRAMTPTDHRIEVRQDDGSVETLDRTLWRSHHGPMINLPLLGWGLELGFTYRDANVDNTSVLAQFLGMCQATDLDSFKEVFADVQGLPWVNTLAADRSGRCWYVDASATPRLSEEAQQRFRERVETDLVAALLLQNRVALLDGSDPGDDWLDAPGARSPGLEPFESLPQLERRDAVVNANDSHWLTHPDDRLEGYPVLCGFERTGRSLRTRQNLRVAHELAATGKVTPESAIEAMLSNESLSAELLVDQVVERCREAGTVTVGGQEVDLAAVADVLEQWDRRYDLDSVGAALWREVLGGLPETALRDAGPLFSVPFDPDDPVATPHTLAAPAEAGPAADPFAQAAGRAVLALTEAGVPLDAPLGDVQWAQRGDARIPVHGGGEVEGLLNVLTPYGALPSASLEPGPPKAAPLPERERTGLAAGGYQCDYGTSFLMAVELTDDGPEGIGLLAYGQSGDPASPNHRDGTEAYAAKQVRPLLFREEDIEADPGLRRRTVTGPAGPRS